MFEIVVLWWLASCVCGITVFWVGLPPVAVWFCLIGLWFGSSFLFNWFLDSGGWIALWFCDFRVVVVFGLWVWIPGVLGVDFLAGLLFFVGLRDILSGSRFGCFVCFVW